MNSKKGVVVNADLDRIGAHTYLELGRGTASSFFFDFVDIVGSDGLRDELL